MPSSILRLASTLSIVAVVACADGSSITGTSPQDAGLASGTGSSGTTRPAVPTGSSGSGGSTSTKGDRVRIEVPMLAPPGGAFSRANGKAKWDSRGPNAQREIEFEVEDITAGTAVNFFLGGVQFGSTVNADAYGQASVERSTQLGHTVPTSVAGLTAEVRTTDGRMIASGAFPD
jgi:hypothetical protein